MERTIIYGALAALAAVAFEADACTNLIAAKGATADGSVMMTYSADSHNLYGFLHHSPAGKHAKGETRKVLWSRRKWMN